MVSVPVVATDSPVISSQGRDLVPLNIRSRGYSAPRPRGNRYWFILLCVLAGCSPAERQQGETVAERRGQERTTGETFFHRGVALARAGQLVRAEQYLSLALGRGYQEEETLRALLGVCLASSRLRAALNYAESRLVRHPDDWSLRYLVASIYLAMGEHWRAREELERVLAYRAEFEPAHYLLATVMRDSFADPRATGRHFSAYLRIAPRGEHADEAAAWLRAHPAEAEADGQVIPSSNGEYEGGRR
jgi:tetratricopeptide (TPR) repeat protein